MHPLLQSLLLIVVGQLTSFVGVWFWFARNRKIAAADKSLLIEDKHTLALEKIIARIVELEKKSELINQQVVPISTLFQSILIKELTHYHTPVMDALLEKLGPPYRLTPEEEVELIAALIQRTQDMSETITDLERDAAAMLPMLMKRVRHETAMVVELQLVAVPGYRGRAAA